MSGKELNEFEKLWHGKKDIIGTVISNWQILINYFNLSYLIIIKNKWLIVNQYNVSVLLERSN